MTETTPPTAERPTAEDVRCRVDALKHQIQQARTSADRNERAQVARDTHASLDDLRTLVGQLEPADREPIQSEYDSLVREHAALSVSALNESTPSDPTTPTPAPVTEEPAPVEQAPQVTPDTTNGAFVAPHPNPTTMTQRFDNVIARLSYYAGKVGHWVGARFQQNPAAAPIMTAIGVTAVTGLIRNMMGGGAVTSAVETQLTQSVNNMAGASDILQPLVAQLRVVSLTLNRERNDEGKLSILKTLQQNAVATGTPADLFLRNLAAAAQGRFRGAVTLTQLVQIAQETAGTAPRPTITSINIDQSGLVVPRNFSRDFVLTPPSAPVMLNNQPVTTASAAVVGGVTVSRTSTGIRIQRDGRALPAATTLTLSVGTPPSALTRSLRVSA